MRSRIGNSNVTERIARLLALWILMAWCWLAGDARAFAESAALPGRPPTPAALGFVEKLQVDLVVLKAQLTSMISALPELPAIGPFVLARLTEGHNPDFFWQIVVRWAGIFAGAVAVEALAKRLLRPLHQLLPVLGEDSDFGKLGALLVNSLMRAIELAVFGVAAIILFFALHKGPEAAQHFFLTLFGFVAIVRATAIGLRVVLAPSLPALRLPALDDRTARRLYWHLMLVVGLTVGAGLSSEFLQHVGLSSGLALADSLLLNGLGAIAIIIAIWRDRTAIGKLIGLSPTVGGASRRDLGTLFAAYWHAFAISLILAIWIFAAVSRLLTREVQVGHIFATLGVLIALPVADGLARMSVRHLFDPRDEPAAPRSDTAPPDTDSEIEGTSFAPVILRNGRIALAVIASVLVAQIWGVSLSAIGPEGAGARIAGAAFQIVVTLVLASSAWGIVKIAINRHTPHEGMDVLALGSDSVAASGLSRLETLLPLVRKFLFVTIAAMLTMSVVSSLGVDIGPLLAGAGVVGIAIGFGAQTLVRDILSGIFFLLDDAFRIGEYIDVGDGKGTVEHISIRALILRHQRGPVYTVPFGAVRRVVNYSREWAITKLEIRVPFDTDVEKVRRLVKKIGEELSQEAQFGSSMLQPLKSQGINRIDDSALVLRVKFMTKPNDQFLVRREVYRRLQETFHRNGIEFASHRVAVETVGSDVDEDEAGAAANLAVLASAGGARSLG
jgi:moderate conductance mechanosensitive channel